MAIYKILISEEVDKELQNIIPNCEKEINLITGFCKSSTLTYLDSLIPSNVKKKLLVRFLPSDIVSGATDKEIYSYCKTNGWNLFVDFSIHAKTFVFDKTKCILGSANVTNKGLGIAEDSNKEAAVCFDLDEESYKKITTLYADAIKMTDDLYNEIINITDDSLMPNVFKKYHLKETMIDCLFPTDFPSEDTNATELYNLRSYKWLIQFLKSKETKSAYFGEITEAIHNVFVKDPRPFRKDVKQHLVDLLAAIKRLKIKEIEISRPQHSELVKYVENVDSSSADNKETNNNKYIFVSYSHNNSKIVLPIIQELSKKYNVWYDERIPFASDWEMKIADTIASCELFLAMLSDDYFLSEHCENEIIYARNKQKPILTIKLYENINMPNKFDYSLSKFQSCLYTKYNSPVDFVSSIEKQLDNKVKQALENTKK